jgi:DNA modification methylase
MGSGQHLRACCCVAAVSVIHADCIEGMRMFEDSCFDSIVCDPPYELGFMGKTWDASGIAYSVEMWAEALRVLKPGGHLLAFSGSRTYHRMACAIEDAGFEVRDQIMWVYGSGFPKSLDVSKAIDKAAGAVREKIRVDASKLGNPPNLVGGVKNGSDTPRSVAAVERGYHEVDSDTPATAAAQQWDGWGTALKPAHEPICVARKPLIGTVAANVLAWGTGAINVDACRVEQDGSRPSSTGGMARKGSPVFEYAPNTEVKIITTDEGRWPANLIHDGSDEVVALFPDSNGSGSARGLKRSELPDNGWGSFHTEHQSTLRDAGTGSAARFFYCAKANKADRDEGLGAFPIRDAAAMQGNLVAGQRLSGNGVPIATPTRANIHPTVKPTDLMRYLCRLVTPPGGWVLDPFAGSGSTGKAAKLEGFRFLGFELSAEYTAIANARIEAAK